MGFLLGPAQIGMMGGGGGGGPTLPTVAGLYAHYKNTGPFWQDSARTTVASADGDPVGAWDDASGNGRHLLQATAGFRMTHKLAILNGRSIRRSDGSDDFLATADYGVPLAQPSTVFVVCPMNALNKCSLAANGANRNELAVFNNPKPGMYAGVVLEAAVSTALAVWSCVFNGASSEFYRNGTLAVSGNAGTGSRGALTLGAFAGGSSPCGGDYAEVLIYSAALSSTDRQNVENFLKTKYGL